MKVYKYCSVEDAIKIVKSGGIRLNNPKNFNDPYDSQFEISKQDEKKTLSLLNTYFIFKRFVQYFKENKNKFNSGQLRLINNINKDIDLAKKIIKDNSKIEINSKFGLYYTLFPDFSKMIPEIVKENKKRFKDTIENVQDLTAKALIGCFSKRYDSILMWSHYGNLHKGVCLEFEVKDNDLSEVKYSDNKYFFDIYNIVEKMLIGDFLEDKDISKSDDINKLVLTPYIVKAKDRSYEEEVRFLCSLKEIEKFYPLIKTDRKFYYLNFKLTKVFIGTKACDNFNLNNLYLEAKTINKDIVFVYMKLSDNEYKVVPDLNKKFKYNNIALKRENCLETIKNEINLCLKNKCYISALILGLSIPSILSKSMYPELNERERYLKWFKENIEDSEHDDEHTENQTPYLNGELCLRLKEKLQNNGCLLENEDFDDFSISKVNLLIHDENPYGFYPGLDGHNFDSYNSDKLLFNFNLRYFLKRMFDEIDLFLKSNKEINNSFFEIINYDETCNLDKQKLKGDEILKNKYENKIDQ